MQIKNLFRALYGILAGSLLYIPLVLLPLAGPLYAGIFAGKKARTMPIAGFFAGIASAILGYLFWINVIFPFFSLKPGDLVSGIFWVLFLAWNVFCALLAGIGGMLGSILSYSENRLSMFSGKTMKNEPIEPEDSPTTETNAPTFIICPDCGTSNQEDSANCKNCGKDIR